MVSGLKNTHFVTHYSTRERNKREEKDNECRNRERGLEREGARRENDVVEGLSVDYLIRIGWSF